MAISKLSGNIRIFANDTALAMDISGKVFPVTEFPKSNQHFPPIAIIDQEELRGAGLSNAENTIRRAMEYTRKHRLYSNVYAITEAEAQLDMATESTGDIESMEKYRRRFQEHLRASGKGEGNFISGKKIYKVALETFSDPESLEFVLTRFLEAMSPHKPDSFDMAAQLQATQRLEAILRTLPDECAILDAVGMDFYIQHAHQNTYSSTIPEKRFNTTYTLGTFTVNGKNKSDGTPVIFEETAKSCATDRQIVLRHDFSEIHLQHELAHDMAYVLHRIDRDINYRSNVSKEVPPGRTDEQKKEIAGWVALNDHNRDFDVHGYLPPSFPVELIAEMREIWLNMHDFALEMGINRDEASEMAFIHLEEKFPHTHRHYKDFREHLATTAKFIRKDGMNVPEAEKAIYLQSLDTAIKVAGAPRWPQELPRGQTHKDPDDKHKGR